MAYSTLFSVFLILWLAGRASADGGDDFANNLASDLGPIVSLFGERVVMQFMSQAMGIADCILLAVAPIGAITTVVSAIRVAGPAWLKSFIGRARENLSLAEIEVMSSTSTEACELWNGHSVVRCPGTADIYQFICLLPRVNVEFLSKTQTNIQCSSLKAALKQGLLQKINTTGPAYARKCFQSDLQQWSRKIKLFCRDIFYCITSFSLRQLLRKRHGMFPQGHSDAENGDNSQEGSTINVEMNDLTSAKSSTLERILRAVSEDSDRRELGDGRVIRPQIEESGNSEHRHVITIVADTSDESAPNILFNCHDKVGRNEIYFAAAFGMILQFGAIVYFGFITYHKPIQDKFLKDGKRPVEYAFPCAAAGTVLLVFGLFICAWVVGESTTESYYAAKDHQIFVIWLQKSHTLSDQIFKPYAIYPTSIRNYITSSRRKQNLRPLELITFFGALISLVGFISQFIGMRGLNWTASVVQLGITILVTMIRVIVRRGLGKPPLSRLLESTFELDWFALSFGNLAAAPWAAFKGNIYKGGKNNDTFADENSAKWSVRTGGEQTYHVLKHASTDNAQLEENSPAHNIMLTRQRLGQLSQWNSAVFEEADYLSNAIATIADTLLAELGGKESLVWAIPATYGTRNEQIYIELRKQGKKWTVDPQRIAAILSLWLYSTPSAKVAGTNLRHDLRHQLPYSLRLYGSSQFKERLFRDLEWWMPEVVSQMSMCKLSEIEDFKSFGRTVVGFTSESHMEEAGYQNIEVERYFNSEYIALECQDKQERLFSRDLLFSFIRAIAKRPEVTIPSASSEGQMNYSKMGLGWREMKLKNATISSLARNLEKLGFGTPSDIYFDLIVPLSLEQKLTNIKNVIDEATKQAQTHERSCQWKKLVDTCSCLLDLALRFDLEKESSGPLAVAICLEFYCRMRQEEQLQDSEGRVEEQLLIQLSILKKKFENGLLLGSTWFTRWISLPADNWNYGMAFSILIGSSSDHPSSFPVSFGVTPEHLELMQKVDSDKTAYSLTPEKFEKVDAFGWSPLHYAANLQRHNLRIVFSETGEVLSLRDLMGWTPLHHACLHGNEKVMDFLLDHNAAVEIAGYDGVTPLHCAVRGGNTDIVQQLIENAKLDVQATVYVDHNERHPIHWAAVEGHVGLVQLLKDGINLTDRFGWTCLHLAVIHRHEDLLEYITENCVININMGDNDCRTPLHLAVETESPAAVELLIKAGADVNAKSKSGSTPLHMAVNQEDIVQILLRYGAADMEAIDIEGRTPLYLAVADGMTEVAALLIEQGANVATAAKDGRTPLHMAVQHRDIAQKLIKEGANIEAIDIEGHTPLYLAAADGTAEVAALLINMGAVVDTAAKDGRTPLHMALSRGEDGLDIAKGLLYSGYKPGKNPYSNATAKDSATPLHIAAEYGPAEAIDMLYKLGADINSTDEYGQTALLIAIYQENWDIAEFLLDVGADIKADDRNGYTPLLGAVFGGHEAIVEHLLDAGADFDAADEDGYSSIHLAVSRGDFKILRQLLKAGANINSVNILDQTPLHIAVRKANLGMVQILLENEANTGLLNYLNFSPLQYALFLGDLEIVQEFVHHDRSNYTTATKATLQRSKDGDTPLHTLCKWTHQKSGEQKMCKMLDQLLRVASERGLNAKNDDGHTPLDLAVSMATGYRAFIYRLIENGAESGSEESFRRFKAWNIMRPNEGSSSA